MTKKKTKKKTQRKQVDEGNRAERRATLLLTSVALVFCAVLVLPFLLKSTKLDENLCPMGGEATSGRATMVLIDLTDDVPELKRGGILSATRQVISSLEKHERFSLFVLRPSKTKEFMPVFSACNPGVPEWSDYLTKGRRQLKAEFEKGFAGTVESALNRELASKQEALTSPIIEAIRDISLSQYWARRNRLFVFSDLIEHSTLTSLYRKNQEFEALLRSPASFVINSIDLRDSTVVVCPTDHRAEKVDLEIQANALAFFKRFFAHARAGCLAMGCQKMTEACGGR